MKITREQLMKQLTSFGYQFGSYTVSTTGNYTVKDAMWNYQDAVMHIPHVHKLVRNFPILVGNDVAGSFFLQKALGLRFPLVVLDILSTETTQTAFTTCFFFVLIIENKCEPVDREKTCVTTVYHIAAPRFFRWCIPLIAWVLKRNYKDLTSTDIPMRERRGELRRWNYSIGSDREPLTYRRALNIQIANIEPPAASPPFTPVSVDLRRELGAEQVLLLGRCDHLGLKLQRINERIEIYPRMCPHEGAALDSTPCQGKSMTCPWHGRVITPVATLSVGTDSSITSEYHHIALRGDTLTISGINA